jgi:5-methyltetrahydropteroyltriglutamate--homocysteine methyltransferase
LKEVQVDNKRDTRVPLFPVTTVGSWPRSREILRALRDKQHGRISAEQFDAIADQAALNTLRLQEAVGVDIVTDGEQRRDNFFSFVADNLEGVRLMSLAERPVPADPRHVGRRSVVRGLPD